MKEYPIVKAIRVVPAGGYYWPAPADTPRLIWYYDQHNRGSLAFRGLRTLKRFLPGPIEYQGINGGGGCIPFNHYMLSGSLQAAMLLKLNQSGTTRHIRHFIKGT
jgi:hypothetical protein